MRAREASPCRSSRYIKPCFLDWYNGLNHVTTGWCDGATIFRLLLLSFLAGQFVLKLYILANRTLSSSVGTWCCHRALYATPCRHTFVYLVLQDFVADVADLNPEYCVGSIVPDLLQTDSLEAQLIALRALHLVATSVPRDSVAAFERDGNIPRRSTTLAASSSNNSSSNSKQMMQVRLSVPDTFSHQRYNVSSELCYLQQSIESPVCAVSSRLATNCSAA